MLFFFSFRGKETHDKALRTSAWETKGLFTWRWGTQGRWANPLRWGNPPFRVISHFNLIKTFTWYVGWLAVGYLTYLGFPTSMQTGLRRRASSRMWRHGRQWVYYCLGRCPRRCKENTRKCSSLLKIHTRFIQLVHSRYFLSNSFDLTKIKILSNSYNLNLLTLNCCKIDSCTLTIQSVITDEKSLRKLALIKYGLQVSSCNQN